MDRKTLRLETQKIFFQKAKYIFSHESNSRTTNVLSFIHLYICLQNPQITHNQLFNQINTTKTTTIITTTTTNTTINLHNQLFISQLLSFTSFLYRRNWILDKINNWWVQWKSICKVLITLWRYYISPLPKLFYGRNSPNQWLIEKFWPRTDFYWNWWSVSYSFKFL